MPTGTRLIYRLERIAAPPGAGVTGTIELALQAEAGTGARQAIVEIVAGERRQVAGPFPSLVGNPVAWMMLERDVTEISRMSGGSPYYLRNRVREALGGGTSAEPARVTVAGREVDGWRVTVSPFAEDRHRDKLRQHGAKRYEFTLSDAVPGGLYEMRLVTPGADGTPLVEDRLTFERSQPAQGDAR